MFFVMAVSSLVGLVVGITVTSWWWVHHFPGLYLEVKERVAAVKQQEKDNGTSLSA